MVRNYTTARVAEARGNVGFLGIGVYGGGGLMGYASLTHPIRAQHVCHTVVNDSPCSYLEGIMILSNRP